MLNATHYTPHNEAVANGELIIRAVNAHYGLLTACRVARGFICEAAQHTLNVKAANDVDVMLAKAIALAEGRSDA
jgi:hypothetical protein